MKSKGFLLAFSIIVAGHSAQGQVMSSAVNDWAIINRYLSGPTFFPSAPSYFYALYWNNKIKDVTLDSLFIHKFLSGPGPSSHKRSYFLTNYQNLKTIAEIKDSIIIHGYVSNYRSVVREYRSNEQWAKSIKIKYTVAKSYKTSDAPTSYLTGQKGWTSYYLSPNRYEYLQRAKENEMKEK